MILCAIIVDTMYIDDSTFQRSGKSYRRVLLRNSYRAKGKVCHDTIANLSNATDDEIQALKFALKHKGDLTFLHNISDIHTQQGLGVGAVWVLSQLAKRVGISKALGRDMRAKQVLWLVIATVIEQGSRLSAVRLAQRHQACDILNLDGFNENDLYAAMDWLAEQQSAIEDKLFRHHYGEQSPHFFLYDVTSSYFEGEQNELARYGYNRDKKKGKKQIVIGLMTDDDGWPISVEVFEGNTTDTKTVANQVRKMAQRFGVKRVTLVGDRGMLKSGQIDQLGDEKFNYITAITKPQIESLIKRDVLQYGLFDEQIVEVQDHNVRYILRCNPVRKHEFETTREDKLKVLEAFVVKQNVYLSEHPKAKTDVALRKATALSKKLKINRWLVVNSEQETLSIKIDETEKQKVAKLDGCYVIKTDLSAEQLDADKTHARYKGLAVVESAFRTMKTALLEMRAIYVRKANRTRAHVFIIMLAYMLVHRLREYWCEIEATVEEGISELASICAIEVHVPGQMAYQTIPNPRLLGQQLLQKAKITLPDAIPCRHATVDTRKKLVSERKSL